MYDPLLYDPPVVAYIEEGLITVISLLSRISLHSNGIDNSQYKEVYGFHRLIGVVRSCFRSLGDKGSDVHTPLRTCVG